MKTKQITMDARVILKEAITKKSVIEKTMVLDMMMAHPIHPYLIDLIARIVDDAMEHNKSNQEMISNINTALQLCIDRFNGKKIH
jgi:homoserine kinase